MMVNIIKRVITFMKLKANHLNSGGANYIGLNVKFVNRGRIVLGCNVIIRPSTRVYAGNSQSLVSFGDGTELGEHSTISSNNRIVFGNDVLTGPHVFIADHNHAYENPLVPVSEQGVKCNPADEVVIGEGSWLGTNVVVVGNVHIGKHCVIGANSVVTRDIPDYSVAVGIPAKVIKRYDFERKMWVKVSDKAM